METVTQGAETPWLKAYPERVDWAAPISDEPMTRVLERTIARFGDRPCIDFLDKVYSYREIGDLVDRAAKGFQSLGVGPGVKVGILLPNTPYFVICYQAVLKAGGTVVNFNPLYVEEEIERQIEETGFEAGSLEELPDDLDPATEFFLLGGLHLLFPASNPHNV